MSYRYLEEGPTADLMVEARGRTLGEAFAQAALSFFNAFTPLEKIEAKEEFEVQAEGRDLESLLFNLMDELLYINDVENLVAKEVDVEVDMERLVAVARCRGERFQPGRHEPGIMVKAVTYHLMEIKETPEGWIVRVVFDT